MLNNTDKFEFDGYKAMINYSNSKNIFISNEQEEYVDEILKINDFYAEPVIYKGNNPCIYISLNITSSCNLRCAYCFNENKRNMSLDFDTCRKYIEDSVSKTPYAHKYFIDLSGSGEPLLKLDLIIKIADFAMKLSDEICKDVIVMFVSNGILLTDKIATLLQEHLVLFGVSVDGIKEEHDKMRKDVSGCPTYDRIIENVKSIKHKDYVGVNSTVVPSLDLNLVRRYEELDKYFLTISVRIARGNYFNKENIMHLKNEYSKFSDYLINQIKNKDIHFLKKIINGDDFFGGYIMKVITESYFLKRCDAAISRYSLGTDKKEYICSSAVENENLTSEKVKSTDIKACSVCRMKHICGGECFVRYAALSHIDTFMCDLKKHLLYLSLKVIGYLYIYERELYRELISFCNEVLLRQFKDEKLYDFASKNKDKYTYTYLKKLKDNDPLMYKIIIGKAK